VILVVGHEKLNVEMQRTYGNRMTVVKIPKSGGVRALETCGFVFFYVLSLNAFVRFQVVELDVQYRQRIHAQQLHTYFYGQTIAPPRGLSASAIGDADFDGKLAPSSSVVPFGELSFLRIGESEFYACLSLLATAVGSRRPRPSSLSPLQNRWPRRPRSR
jgi:polyribonucleotide 5'-hydroxyl-kinase